MPTLKTFKKMAGAAIFFLLSINLAAAAGYQFNRNLYYGLSGDSGVVQLQNMLRQLGFFPLPASSGNYFGVTVTAVKKFQIANNIKPVSGYFGPMTRAEANRLTNALNTTIAPPFVPANNSATSTYWGRVEVRYADRSNDPENESLTIYNTSTTSESIDITGFKLTNSNGEDFTIPRGYNLPGVSSIPTDDVVLAPDDSAKIITGRQDKQINFRENLCTGYFDQDSNFYGQLSHDCPQPDISGDLNLPDHCIQVFESTESCRTVDQTTIQVPECVEFSQAHLNYQGCVNDNKNKERFYSNDWLIWMQRPSNFLRSIHDKVTLFDRDGKIASIFTY